jgi:hypothetical protein
MFVVVRCLFSVVSCHWHVATNNGPRTTDTGDAIAGFLQAFLPTRQADAGNQALVRQLAEANAANAKLSIHGPRPATELAARLATRAEFRRSLRFGYF